MSTVTPAGAAAHMTSSAVLSASSQTEQQSIDAFQFPHSSSTPKARRQTAYYPHMNNSNKLQKPFSRSAAKRESVMALGSIEHLQHYFTKTGIAARQDSLKENKGLVPAIGSATNRPLRPSLSSIQEFHLPPSPAVPVFNRSPYPSIERTYEVDPENLKPGVIRDLEAVAECWALTGSSIVNEDNNEGPKLDEPFDVLHALRLTTQLIRSVRNYCVSLPDDSIAEQPNKNKQHFRPSSLQPVPIKRVSSSSYGVNANANGGGGATADPMARIRKLALDVLTALRVLEENARLPLSDEAYDAQSDRVSSQGTRSPEPIQAVLENDELQQQQSHQQQLQQQLQQQILQQQRRQSSSPPHDISFAVSVVTVPGRADAVPVWDDYEDEDDLKSEDGENEKKEKRDIWDERLVLGGGWLYRQDIRLSDLAKDREVVGKYLDAVDEALFEGPSRKDGTRGWERAARLEREREAKGRRTSLGLGRHRERERERERGEDVSPLRGGTPRSISPGVGVGVVEAMSNMVISEETESPEQSDAESVDEDDLPEWAKRNTFPDDPLARAHALLFSFLPASLLPLLPSYTSFSSSRSSRRLELLTALSSGQLLCVAYNAGIRRSRKMWGYINKDAIHDIAALEMKAAADDSGGEAQEKRKTGWTFRRIDNLRLWAAALKLRYLVPLTIPAAALSTQQPSIIASTSSNISSSFTPSSASGPSNASSATATSNANSSTNNGATTTGPTDSLSPTPTPTPSRPITPTPTPTSPSLSPSQPSPSSPSRSTSPSRPHPHAASALRPSGGGAPQTMFIPGKGEVPLIGFDAKLVARREEGWDVMLETVLLEWVRAVVEERRSAR